MFLNLLFFQFLVLSVLLQRLCSAIVPADFEALGLILPIFDFNSGFLALMLAVFIFVIVKAEYALKTMFIYLPLSALLFFTAGAVVLESMGLWFWGVMFFVTFAIWYLQCFFCSFRPGLVYLFTSLNLFAGLFIYVDFVHYFLTREHIKTVYIRIIKSFGGSFAENLANAGITFSMLVYPGIIVLLMLFVLFLIAKFGKTLRMSSSAKNTGFAFSLCFLLIYGQFSLFSQAILLEEYFDFKIRNFWFPLPEHPVLKSENLRLLQKRLEQAQLTSEMFNEQPEFQWKKVTARKNIVFLIIESLRADMFEALMPETAKLAKEGIWCKKHLANANETEGALISLYYNSLPLVSERSYYDNNPANWIEFMKNDGYEFFRLTHSAGNLHYPGYKYSLVKDYLKDKYPQDKLEQSIVRDSQLACDAIVERLQDGKKHVIEGFLYHTHYKYWYPKDFEHFKPVLEDNREIVAMDFAKMALRLKNRYKNSLLYTDWLIADFVAKMKQAGVFENTVLVIMGDHGQNLGENGVMFHGTSPAIKQNETVCVILGADVMPAELNSITSHLDIVPTLGKLIGFKTLGSAGKDMLGEKGKGTVTFDISGSNRVIYRDAEGLSSLFNFSSGSGLQWGVTCNHDFVFDQSFQKNYKRENLESILAQAQKHSELLIEIIRSGNTGVKASHGGTKSQRTQEKASN